ncbi:hypothetical protein RBSWK_06287 [Rhodopirellula baltica SWK14]|uniref:Uncharacterized protein n=1 Tax=Rhodopirellula baltica SWK14 TaxID=993516 RepID=L7C6E5_RHOBT|nr:hypothetical protein RBSWK_06287 [Rhodopirellula baltica SWK14]
MSSQGSRPEHGLAYCDIKQRMNQGSETTNRIRTALGGRWKKV